MGTTERPLSPGTEQRPPQINHNNQNTNSYRDSQCSNVILKAAKLLLSHGFSVIPTKADKRPALRSWTQYQKKAMSDEKAEQVFRNAYGLGIVCGVVSGNLECMDFDNPALWRPFMETL